MTHITRMLRLKEAQKTKIKLNEYGRLVIDKLNSWQQAEHAKL